MCAEAVDHANCLSVFVTRCCTSDKYAASTHQYCVQAAQSPPTHSLTSDGFWSFYWVVSCVLVPCGAGPWRDDDGPWLDENGPWLDEDGPWLGEDGP